MDDIYRHQLQEMRRQSRYIPAGKREPVAGEEGLPEASGFYFRSFLAMAFIVACIGFSLVPDSPIPEPLKHIGDRIAVNYTLDDLMAWKSSLPF